MFFGCGGKASAESRCARWWCRGDWIGLDGLVGGGVPFLATNQIIANAHMLHALLYVP